MTPRRSYGANVSFDVFLQAFRGGDAAPADAATTRVVRSSGTWWSRRRASVA